MIRKKYLLFGIIAILITVYIAYPTEYVPKTLHLLSLKSFVLTPSDGFIDARNWDTFDLQTELDNQKLGGFIGITTDSKYVYLSPDFNGDQNQFALRYDIQKDFMDKESWQTFDLYNVTNKVGFVGTGYLDGYVYYAPYWHNKMIRYSTNLDFNDTKAWQVNEINTSSFWGSISNDGKYMYYSPTGHSNIVRYDTSKDFESDASWETFDAKNVASKTGYYGSKFDGKFIYFIPRSNTSAEYHGEVLRYDTTMPFHSKESWQTFDLETITDNVGFLGGTFDGRYLYLSPYRNDDHFHGTVIRFDTTKEFVSPTSWESFRLSKNHIGYSPKGFLGAAYDGKFIYFSPFYNEKGYHGEIVRYDTTKPFTEDESWDSFYPKMNFVGKNPVGYGSVAFTGNHLYFAPYNNNEQFHGEVLRYTIKDQEHD